MSRSLFIDQHPVWFVFILEIAIVFVCVLTGMVGVVLRLTNQASYGISNVILVVTAILLVSLLGWWKTIGFHSLKKPGDAGFFLIAFIPVVANIIPGINPVSIHHVVIVFFIALSVGFVEEVFFRGLMLNALQKLGPWFAILTASFLCAFIHGINAMTSKSMIDTLGMMLNAVAVGIAFSALVIKKGVIWPLVIAHFLADSFLMLQKPGGIFPPLYQLILTSAVSVVLILYGIWLMTHPVRNTVLAKESLT